MKLMQKTVWVYSCRDTDGYYIPVLASESKNLLEEAVVTWVESQKANPYWQPEYAIYEYVPLIWREENGEQRA